MKIHILIVFTAVLLSGCRNGSPSPAGIDGPEAPADAELQTPEQDLPMVSLSTMGKVVALRSADLSFESALPVVRINVRNGQSVRRGQVLVELDRFKLRNALEQQRHLVSQAALQEEQARLQMQDVIISQGYDPEKTGSIPESVLHNADVKSGHALSLSSLEAARTRLSAAEHALGEAVLRAPFDGVVANLSLQAHQLSQAGQTVCRVIDTSALAVEFRVMEADLSRFHIGTELIIVPVSDSGRVFDATVSEINPVVDTNGAVAIRASLSKSDGLFEGMNAEVILK